MKKVLLIIFDGFEEVEALCPADILRRAGAKVDIMSVEREGSVSGRSGIKIVPDGRLDFESDFSEYEMLVIPGGGGVFKIADDERVLNIVKKFALGGKFIAAICAAPIVLKNCGLTNGRKITSHSSVRDRLGTCESERVVVDSSAENTLITSQGAGTAMEFSLVLADLLFGNKTAKEIAISVHFFR